MGTRGYEVYRHKGRFFVMYNHCDSYPRGLGRYILSVIPKERDKFKRWLRDKRAMVDAEVKRWESMTTRERGSSRNFVSSSQPRTDVHIEWVYELDLDNLVFHINACPVLRLHHMPPAHIFLNCISFDHYGGVAYASNTPAQYRYNWRSSPPAVNDITLETYMHHNSSIASIHELLSIREALTNREVVRVKLLEVCVGSVITLHGTRVLRQMESLPDRESMTQRAVALAMTFVLLSLSTTPFSEFKFRVKIPESKFWWPQSDVCVLLCTHLDYEKNLQAAISELVEHILEITDGKDIVYGVAFSVFHCAIVRVDTGAGLDGPSVRHTPTLNFIPSYYAESPSTPGITALALLSQTIRFNHRAIMSRYLQEHDMNEQVETFQVPSSSGQLARLPVEILEKTAGYILDTDDLVAFAMSSQLAMLASVPSLKYPRVGRYPLFSNRLVAIKEDDVESNSKPRLHTAAFGTITEDGPGVMVVAADLEKYHCKKEALAWVDLPRFHGLGREYRLRYTIVAESTVDSVAEGVV